MSKKLFDLWTKAWRRVNRRLDASNETAGARPPSTDDQALSRALSLLDIEQREQYRTLAETIRARPSQFLYELIPFKESLTKQLSLQEACQIFGGLLSLPSETTIEHLPVRSLFDVASAHAITFRETAPAGLRFTAQPPRVIGVGDQRPLECVTRSLYVACLPDAYVHGRSALIEFRGSAVLDFQGGELEQVDEHLILDLPVLQAGKKDVWLATSRTNALRLDEGFNLLGPNTPQFGHWMWEYMPKYVAAVMSAKLSNVPILIDAYMPATHREFLEMLLPPNAEVVEVPYNGTVRVRRLWCAANLAYIPTYIKTLDPNWPAYEIPLPEHFAAVFNEITRRAEAVVPSKPGPERIYLARKPDQLKKLVNYSAIEQCARERGFYVFYPQDLTFAEQIQLMRGARYIIGPEGSALFLGFLARPATKLCIVSSIHMFNATSYTCLLEAIGLDTTIFTGEVVNESKLYPHFADYRISEEAFRAFLGEWLQ
jgi:capsular polysaccharide biosynthesis protein